jgi:hypothetical protein
MDIKIEQFAEDKKENKVARTDRIDGRTCKIVEKTNSVSSKWKMRREPKDPLTVKQCEKNLKNGTGTEHNGKHAKIKSDNNIKWINSNTCTWYCCI